MFFFVALLLFHELEFLSVLLPIDFFLHQEELLTKM